LNNHNKTIKISVSNLRKLIREVVESHAEPEIKTLASNLEATILEAIENGVRNIDAKMIASQIPMISIPSPLGGDYKDLATKIIDAVLSMPESRDLPPSENTSDVIDLISDVLMIADASARSDEPIN
jgi:hypothetical protein